MIWSVAVRDKFSAVTKNFILHRAPSEALRQWASGLGAGMLWAVLLLVTPAVAQEYAITAVDIAPAQLLDGQSSGVLRLELSNPSGGGVPVVRWESLGLRFEAADGVPLSTAGTGALVATMEIYKDANGSAALESGNDVLVASGAYLPVAADGSLNFLFDGSDPAALQVASGASATYFVVLRLADGASAATPSTVRLTHLASGPSASTARHAGTEALLTMAPAPDVSSSVVQAVFDAPPTTTGLVPVAVQEPSRPVAISLRSAFGDAEDAPALLTYSVVGNTDAALFGFAGIDPSTGILTLDPAASANGRAQLTIQATDTAGKSVSTVLTVNVGPIGSYSAFAAAYFGGGGPGISGPTDDPGAGGVSNLLKYAFFLHPLKNDDHAGLPRVERVGNARVFSHLRPKYANDLLYTYETSTDLDTWTPAVNGVDYFTETLDVGDGSQRIECLLLGGAPKVFMRARVQLTSNPPPPGAGSEGAQGVGVGGVGVDRGSAAASGSAPPPSPLPIHSSVVFTAETAVPTSGESFYPFAMIVADVNNDGWKDIVSISFGDDKVSWYANNNGTFGPRQILNGTTRGGRDVAAADLTGDGLPDIAAASILDNKISWYRNLGGGEFAALQVIATNATYAVAVAIGDIDHDGLPDIISASGSGSGSKLAWYKNHGAPTYFITGEEHPILGSAGTTLSAAGDNPYCIAADNIDQDADGYVDLAVASQRDNSVAFLRGNGDGTFTRQVLSSSQSVAIKVTLGDMDGDGLKDIVSISSGGGQISWFKNNGSAPFGGENAIAIGTVGLQGLTVTDFNKDGKPDVLVSTVQSFGGVSGPRLLWFENLGGGTFGNPAANARLISINGVDATSVAAADFDQNGLMDAAVVWSLSHKLSIYSNQGGQFSLATADTAPPAICESGRADVLRVAVSNRGSVGEDNAQLSAISLLFEKAAGVAMTTAEANQLIENLHIYVDSNSSGVFDPTVDKLAATTQYLTLIDGKVSISLRHSKPADVQVAPATTRYFFVVPQITANGSTQIPNSFRITHLVEGSDRSVAKEARSGASLTIEPGAANLASSFITAAPNSAPTSTGIPNLTVFDTASSTVLPLTAYFGDLEDGATALQYALTNNSNPGLFSFAGIDPATRRLSLKYHAGVSGAASLTVRATDSLGKSVSATFQVAVGFTFSDWATLYPGAAGGAGPLAPAQLYAFGFSPLSPGDTGNAPSFFEQGGVKVLRHYRQRWSTDLTYSYEISPDLENWEPAVSGVHFYEFRSPLANGIDQSDLVILSAWPRAFVRPTAQLP